MANVQLILPDGKLLDAAQGAPFRDVVRTLGEGLLRSALAVTVDGANYTLDDLVDVGGRFTVITRGSEPGLETLRHSAAHLMAWAVSDLFPGVKFAFGPAIESGFYYDFERAASFTE